MDETLPGLTRKLALRGREAADDLLDLPPRAGLYRELYRALRTVFERRFQANRYCGGAMSCEHGLDEAAPTVKHEDYPGARVRVLLAAEDVPPNVLILELEAAMVKAVAKGVPGRKLPGLAPTMKAIVEKALRGRFYRSEPCGHSPLCGMNEAYDPWDRREPLVHPVTLRFADRG